MGRPTREIQNPVAGNAYVDTQYDADGRVWKVATVPCERKRGVDDNDLRCAGPPDRHDGLYDECGWAGGDPNR